MLLLASIATASSHDNRIYHLEASGFANRQRHGRAAVRSGRVRVRLAGLAERLRLAFIDVMPAALSLWAGVPFRPAPRPNYA